MGSKFRCFIAATASACCLAAIATQALAQAYPARPIRLVVPFAAGGPSDLLGRTLAQKLGEILPEPIVVENRVGGGATIGTASVAKAAADGYTLLLGDIVGFAVNPYFYKALPYNARKDFTPIGPVASGAVFIFAHASLPARSIRELIALAKNKPGAMSYASAGTGSFPSHIAPELFKLKHGLDILHVPYKGTGPAMTDVVAGRVSFIMTSGYGTAKPFLESGKLRALAVTGEKRSAAMPEVPTFAEAGFPLPEMNAGGVYGLVGPAGLPRNIVVKLSESLTQALKAPDVLARLSALNLEPMLSTPDAFAEFINTGIETWAQVFKRMNIALE